METSNFNFGNKFLVVWWMNWVINLGGTAKNATIIKNRLFFCSSSKCRMSIIDLFQFFWRFLLFSILDGCCNEKSRIFDRFLSINQNSSAYGIIIYRETLLDFWDWIFFSYYIYAYHLTLLAQQGDGVKKKITSIALNWNHKSYKFHTFISNISTGRKNLIHMLFNRFNGNKMTFFMLIECIHWPNMYACQKPQNV